MIQSLQHKLEANWQRLLHVNTASVMPFSVSVRQFVVLVLTFVKPGSKQLFNLAIEGLIQNIFGQNITKAFLVLLLQSYCMPVFKLVLCRARQLAAIKALVHSATSERSLKPCFN